MHSWRILVVNRQEYRVLVVENGSFEAAPSPTVLCFPDYGLLLVQHV